MGAREIAPKLLRSDVLTVEAIAMEAIPTVVTIRLFTYGLYNILVFEAS